MSPLPVRTLLATLPILGIVVLGASCGGGAGDEAPPVDPPVSGACTGSVPQNAALCPGTDTDLTADAQRVVVGTCQEIPCSYVCNSGYFLVGGACQPDPPAGGAEFVDNGDGTVTVTDGYGTIVWLRDANCLEAIGGVGRGSGPVLWTDALAWTSGLASGACGLTDGSAPGDWGLPILSELQYLAADLASSGQAGWGAFTGIQGVAYWTDFSTCVGFQSAVVISTGLYLDVQESDLFNVWPIRR